MVAETGMVLVALTLLAAKHFFADFALQTDWMVRGKGTYCHPGGLTHAGVHMLGSMPALAVMGLGLFAILPLVVVEGIVHYHIDWGKQRLTHNRGTNSENRLFWLLLGADQFLHHLTYIGMVAIAVQIAT
jgi:hypothetical protein